MNTDCTIVRAALALRASRTRILWTVSMPGAAPLIFTGFRISMSIAFVVIIAAEMVAAQDRLGWLILDAQRIYATDTVFVGILIISALGFTMNWVMRRLGRLAFPWMQGKDVATYSLNDIANCLGSSRASEGTATGAV